MNPTRTVQPSAKHFGAARPIATCALLSASLVGWGALTSFAEAPIALGNAQIGKTAEEIVGPDPAEDAPVQSEWRVGAPGAQGDAFAADTARAGASGPAVSTYSACVERAVKAGNAFSAAAGVCQAIFPDEAVTAAEASPSVPTLEDTPPDQPIVLKLHGAPPAPRAPTDAPPAPEQPAAEAPASEGTSAAATEGAASGASSDAQAADRSGEG